MRLSLKRRSTPPQTINDPSTDENVAAGGYPELADRVLLIYDGGEVEFDIVLLHGLGSGEFKCWVNERGFFWPGLFLPQDFPRCRVLSAGYSHALWRKAVPPLVLDKELGGDLNLERCARQLASRLLSDAVGVGQRPVVFITHSMGGLILKRMVTSIVFPTSEDGEGKAENVSQTNDVHSSKSNDTLNDASSDVREVVLSSTDGKRRLKCLLHSLRGVVFYATPHFGAPIASLITGLSRYYEPFGGIAASEVLAALSDRNHEALAHLNEKFFRIIDSSEIPVDVLSFAESRRISGMVRIVEPESANPVPGDPRFTFHVIDADHYGVNRPVSKTQLSYSALFDFIYHMQRSGRLTQTTALPSCSTRMEATGALCANPGTNPGMDWSNGIYSLARVETSKEIDPFLFLGRNPTVPVSSPDESEATLEVAAILTVLRQSTDELRRCAATQFNMSIPAPLERLFALAEEVLEYNDRRHGSLVSNDAIGLELPLRLVVYWVDRANAALDALNARDVLDTVYRGAAALRGEWSIFCARHESSLEPAAVLLHFTRSVTSTVADSMGGGLGCILPLTLPHTPLGTPTTALLRGFVNLGIAKQYVRSAKAFEELITHVDTLQRRDKELENHSSSLVNNGVVWDPLALIAYTGRCHALLEGYYETTPPCMKEALRVCMKRGRRRCDAVQRALRVDLPFAQPMATASGVETRLAANAVLLWQAVESRATTAISTSPSVALLVETRVSNCYPSGLVWESAEPRVKSEWLASCAASGQFDKTAQEMSLTLHMSDRHPLASCTRGYELLWQGDLLGAEEAFGTALALTHDATHSLHRVAAVGLGWVHLQRIHSGLVVRTEECAKETPTNNTATSVAPTCDASGRAKDRDGGSLEVMDVLALRVAPPALRRWWIHHFAATCSVPFPSSARTAAELEMMRAINLFRTVLSHDPSNPGALCGMGRAHTLTLTMHAETQIGGKFISTMEFPAAARFFTASYSARMHHPDTHEVCAADASRWASRAAYWLGALANDTAASQQWWKVAVDQCPQNDWAMTALGLAKLGAAATPQEEDGIQLLQNALDVNQKNAWTLWGLGKYAPDAAQRLQCHAMLVRLLKR